MAKAPSKSNDVLIAAQELAKRTGEPYDALNHWARIGLLPYKKRGRTRLFAAVACVDRCRQIRELQGDGHNLTTIRGMLAKR